MNQPDPLAPWLKAGNERQRHALSTLERLDIFQALAVYTPTLVGTVPLDIDVACSDLDIVCEVHDFDGFEKLVRRLYGHMDGFLCVSREVDGIQRIKAGFQADGWPIELFGQPIPVERQNGFRHMVVEHRLLQRHGDKLKCAVRKLKEQGVKTEPAFAIVLGLEGDPYEALLADYTPLSD